MSKYREPTTVPTISFEDIEILKKLVDTKKLTEKQKTALRKLLSYYYSLGQKVRANMTNKEWVDLITKEFNCSKSIAKEMLHAMYEVREKNIRLALFTKQDQN